MRSIKKIHKAEYRPIADLVTYSPMPTRSLQQIDPFIFLNHHGFQTYPERNQGLPFGPHPHRGMETVTFILEGDIMHKDSSGHESVIGPGGVQYMTAGSGLIHAEVSSTDFKRNGGDLEILQLWLNLPAAKKMITPNYLGLQQEDIPTFDLDGGKLKVQQLFGEWNGVEGAFEGTFPITMSTIYLEKGGKFEKEISAEENIFFYIVRGELNVNGTEVMFRNLVEFGNSGQKIEVEALEDSILILGHALPFNEPMVAQGPFVMNTQQQIQEAYTDYQAGKFGAWNH
ncbi:MAG: pirin family protein [Algoriphagus sp.]|jgi:redox-sensitive bicupin YhaK (pirin superfamily)|uniref:pirin family protein n=1 Tax=Algoriphagus sp. TaxID=1872435 RepID=UPI00271AC1EF|nr:pirin family protein [Algoriphagus sp.]MDO8966511.1 pirin family protein [Algoriphagus sp.]MDP2041668.1 pirin family protein [Algoriphagus sp.]MDP3201957.1 pirin family protein [Algoriphagus sp.]MDP3471492.1 pirin family protein [Algoriphagus sp.]